MAKAPKQVTLPPAAENMSERALDQLPEDHFGFEPAYLGVSMSVGSQPIEHVPEQAAAHVPEAVPRDVILPSAALDHMSENALDQLPEDHFVFEPAYLGVPMSPGSQPIEHVPEQAAAHVPEAVPPDVTLPSAALDHMSERALDQLPEDHFVFEPAYLGVPMSMDAQPAEHVPEQAAAHVPEAVPPDVTLPSAALDHMADVAKEQLATHTDWWLL